MRTDIRVRRVRPATAGEWDAIYGACGHATWFHSREWAEIWSAYLGRCAPDARIVEFSDGATALLTMVRRRKTRGLVSAYLSSPSGTYGGWLSGEALGPAHAERLVRELFALGSLEWRVNPWEPLAGRIELPGAVPDTTLAVALDGDFDAVFRTWTKGHRSAVGKARREGVTVSCAEGLEDWRAYDAVYRETIRRWRTPPKIVYAFRLFERLAEAKPGSVRLWLARHEGEVVSGALCLYGPRHVSYWHGASAERALRLRPSNLVVHDAMEAACREGYRWFDLNPSGGHEGVARFKRSFGATPRDCPVVRRIGRREALLGRVAGLVRRGGREHAR